MSDDLKDLLRNVKGELDATGETGNALGPVAPTGNEVGKRGEAVAGDGAPQAAPGGEGKDKGNAVAPAKAAPGKKAKGRRPELIPFAEEFGRAYGAFLHRYREEWFIWSNEQTDRQKEWGGGTWGGWFPMGEESAQAFVNGWLQTAHPDKVSLRIVNFILDYLKAPEKCMVNESLELPVFLDGAARKDRKDDAGGWIIAQNCMVNVEALAHGEPPERATMPLSPVLFSLERVPYLFLPGATCSRWLQYLEETFPDVNDRLMLQMMFGLCLVYDTSLEVIFILFGKGGTGKSTALGVLKKLLGDKRSISLDPEELSEKHAKGDMAGVKVNLISELPDKLPKAQRPAIVAMFKKAASGESIKREPKNRKADYPSVTARIIACANALPDLGDKSGAIYRRLRVILFSQIVPEEKKNPGLLKELFGEMPGIFNWAVEGLRLLRGEYKNQFPRLGKGAAIVEGVKEDADAVGSWLETRVEKCELAEEVFGKDLWEEWKEEVIAEEGQSAFVLEYKAFCKEVRRYFALGKMKKKRRPGDWEKPMGVFVGIRRKAFMVAEDGIQLYGEGEVGGGAGEVAGE